MDEPWDEQRISLDYALELITYGQAFLLAQRLHKYPSRLKGKLPRARLRHIPTESVKLEVLTCNPDHKAIWIPARTHVEKQSSLENALHTVWRYIGIRTAVTLLQHATSNQN